MPVLDCKHNADSGEAQRICQHLLASKGDDYIQRFTGNGLAFDLICSACRQASAEEQNLRTVCPKCYLEIREEGCWDGILGQPEVRERKTPLRFHHDMVHVSACSSDTLLDVQPLSSVDQNLWVAVTKTGQIVRLDLDRRLAVTLCQLPVKLTAPIALHLSRNGQLAAVVNTRGRYGTVFDLTTGQATLPLDRGDYHNEHCNYPVAFCETAERSLLIHGTAWNRLEISDPRSGALLSGRTYAPYQKGTRPEHYLDYFHCGLTVSPTQDYVADNGWVWSPVGRVAAWSIRRWLAENVWESEDGPSKHYLCQRAYYWDGPLCWVGADRLAVWGYGEDADRLLPAVCIFNVVNGQEEKWFPGPKGNLVCDRYLFSFDAQDGIAIWDLDHGERLLHDSSFCPLRYHPGAKAFLTLRTDGVFQVSKLRRQPLDPAWLTWNGATVVRVAKGLDERRAFDQLPVLADALEEAGCQDAEILEHCRRPGPHTAACWVLDWLLGRE